MPRVITSSDLSQGEKIAIRDEHLFGTPRERLEFYRREIHYETSILSDRTNAYLAAQSFLVIAYVSAMGNANPAWGEMFTLVVPAFLALLGFVSSVNAWPGIRAAYRIIQHWHYKQAQLLNGDFEIGHAYDDSPLFCDRESDPANYRKSLLFGIRTPLLFGSFWLVLGLFSLWLHLA